MEMESEELLYDDQNTEEEVDHDLAGVDVDGLLGDEDQSMAGHSDVDPNLVADEGEAVFDTNYEESTEYAEEEEYQENAEIAEGITEDNAELAEENAECADENVECAEENAENVENVENVEESMDQEQEEEQTKQPANADSGGSRSNVCFMLYYLIQYKFNSSPYSDLCKF